MLARALGSLAVLGAWAFAALFCVALAALIRALFTRPPGDYVDPVIIAQLRAHRTHHQHHQHHQRQRP